MTTTVLLTGAAGRVGRYLRAGLPPLGFQLRLFDREPIDEEPDAVCADINDEAAIALAASGVDAIVHLAGASRTADSFETVLEANIRGAYQMFEAARRSGVERVVLASSNHANGFSPRSAGSLWGYGDRPDSYYGVSKVFGESLGRFYHDCFGLKVACIRIGSCVDHPGTPRGLATWLSPGDCARLVAACLRSPELEYCVIYGLSRNTRRFWDLGPARALGYQPLDDAEVYAQDILAEHGGIDPGTPQEPQSGAARSALCAMRKIETRSAVDRPKGSARQLLRGADKGS